MISFKINPGFDRGRKMEEEEKGEEGWKRWNSGDERDGMWRGERINAMSVCGCE